MADRAASQGRALVVLYGLTDALLLAAALTLASLARVHTLYQVDPLTLHRDRLIVVAVFVLASVLAGSYRRTRIVDRFDAAYSGLVSLGATALLVLMLVALVRTDARAISRRELVLGLTAFVPVLVVWRVRAAARLATAGAFRRRFVVAGQGEDCRRVAASLEEGAGGPVESVTPDAVLRGEGPRTPDAPVEYVLAAGAADSPRFPELLDALRPVAARVFVHPALDVRLLYLHAPLSTVAGVPVIALDLSGDRPYLRLKRVADVLVSAAGLLVAVPLMALVAVAVRLTSPGPALYVQERLGRHGRPFRLYKFRTMVAGAEEQTGPVWARENDPRVTGLGRFLRRHRLDELPQLWNVLRGDMSLVGPRPERAHFYEEFRKTWPLFDRRLEVRPGLVSLSHVLGGYDMAPDDRLRYDLMYIGSVSAATDLKVLLASVRVVVGGKGAR